VLQLKAFTAVGEGTQLLRRRTEALGYARHGWPVLPGTRWNGARYVRPDTMSAADGIRPTVPSELATTDPAQIADRWSRYPYSVLLYSGTVFALLSVPAWWAVRATQEDSLRRNPAPVICHPNGSAYFLISPTAGLVAGLRVLSTPDNVVTLWEPGGWVPAPPTRTAGGNLTWLVSPARSQWHPGDSHAVQEALVATYVGPGHPCR
jgi:hypothetical protein